MHRFGDQIELRVDRRHVLLFFFGAVFWTLVAFFFGMLVAGGGKVRTAEKGLAALGWLDQHAQKKLAAQRRQAVGFSFATGRTAPHRAAGVAAAPARRAALVQPSGEPLEAGRHEPIIPPTYAVPGYERRAPRPRALPRKPLPRLPAPTLAVRHKGQWTYRIAMRISRKAKAMQLMRQFQRKRYQPILASLPRGVKGREYRITFGRFASRSKADRVVIQLREAGMLGRIRVIRTR